MPDVNAGQSEARFELLYTIYARRLRAYIAARLGSRYELADDLSQDAWLEVWRSLHTMKAADDRAFGWLATIARRVICRHFRLARSTREEATDFGGPRSRLLPQAPAAEDVALVRETARMELAGSPTPVGVAA